MTSHKSFLRRSSAICLEKEPSRNCGRGGSKIVQGCGSSKSSCILFWRLSLTPDDTKRGEIVELGLERPLSQPSHAGSMTISQSSFMKSVSGVSRWFSKAATTIDNRDDDNFQGSEVETPGGCRLVPDPRLTPLSDWWSLLL